MLDIYYFNHLLPVMLQCKRIEDPIVFLKEDYTILQNKLLGALECKFFFHLFEKYDTNKC